VTIVALKLVFLVGPSGLDGLSAQFRLVRVLRHAVQILHLLRGPKLAVVITVRAIRNRFTRTVAESYFEFFMTSIVLALLGYKSILVGGECNFDFHGNRSFHGHGTDPDYTSRKIAVKKFPEQNAGGQYSS
jgi:hypothetical protein